MATDPAETANASGEVILTLGGARYTLRPSHEAIEEFEGLTGRSLLDLAGQAARNEMSLFAMSRVVGACVRAWGRQTGDKSTAHVNDDKLKELIIEDGPVLLVMKKLGLLLFRAATGGVTAKGEPKPAPATTPPIPDAG